MNYTSSGNRVRKASFSEIVKHSNWYQGVAIILYVLLLIIIGSQIKLWSYFDKSKELRNEWYTDKSTQFKILSKLQTRDSSSDNLIFLLQDTKTGQKLTLNVNAKTYLDHEKGDKVWFTVCKADYYKDNLDKIPDIIPIWFILIFLIGIPIILWIIWGVQGFSGEDSDDCYNCYVYSISRIREINRYKLLMNLPMMIGFPLAIISPITYAILC